MVPSVQPISTVLVTDVHDAPRLWELHPEAMASALARHDAVVVDLVQRHGGSSVAATGEGFAIAFAGADDALACAAALQHAVQAESWPEPIHLEVRVGVATGPIVRRGDSYAGPAIHRAARIMSAARPGQVLVAADTARDAGGSTLFDLGEFRLRDFDAPQHLFTIDEPGPGSAEALDARALRPGNLPVPWNRFVGRSGDLATVVALLDASRLVSVVGVGGVGKTRLAVEAGNVLADGFSDGVWLVELAAVGSPDGVADAIASTLGIAVQGKASVADAIADALAERAVLLVLDTCEHVVDAVAEVADAVLRRSGSPRIVATSREPLGLVGEHLLRLAPLDADSDDAAALFLDRAQAVDAGFDADRSTVAQICRAVDGLALGIELAAAQAAVSSAAQLLDRVEADGLGALAGERRQRGMVETIASSYELLDPLERFVLHHVAVFSGGCTLDALRAVTQASSGIDRDALTISEAVDSLVRKSLVTPTRTAGSVRYTMLETIRAYALRALDLEAPAVDGRDGGVVARDAHAGHFADQVVEHWERWDGPAFHEVSNWLVVEFTNLREAFEWSRSRGRIEVAVDLAAHAAMIGVPIERFEPVGWAESVVGAATAAGVDRLARLHTAAAYSCFLLAGDAAVAHAQAAQELEVDPDHDGFEPGRSGFGEALAHVYCGRLDAYVASARTAAAAGTASGDSARMGLVDGLQAMGRVEEAHGLVDEAFAAVQAAGNPWIIAYGMWIRGSVYAHQDHAAARHSWKEALDFVRSEGTHFFEGFIARDAALLDAVADPRSALTLIGDAVRVFRDSGNRAQLAVTVASATVVFDRLAAHDSVAVLFGAVSGAAGGSHFVSDLDAIAERARASLGDERFVELVAEGAPLDLGAAAQHVLDRSALELARRATRVPVGPGGALSRRELDVLRLMAAGLTTRQIGERLFISPKTADHHIQHVYTKIGVSNRAAATLWAYQHDLAT